MNVSGSELRHKVNSALALQKKNVLEDGEEFAVKEYILAPGDRFTVLGTCIQNPNGRVITKQSAGLIITNKPVESKLEATGKEGGVYLGIGVVLSVIGVICLAVEYGVGVFPLLMGAGMVFYGIRQKKKSASWKQVAPSPIANLAAGAVRVSGTVEGDAHLTTPIGNLPCCAYRTTVERWMIRTTTKDVGHHRETKRERVWEVEAEWEGRVVFHLNDGTHRIAVDPKGAEIDMPLAFEGTQDGTSDNRRASAARSIG